MLGAMPAHSPPAPARLLVVDDEPTLAGLVANYLNRAGFDVRQANDGEQALHLARQWQPEVIVLDLGLPGIDGVEVCRQVRTFSDCYVVMLTARDDELDKLVGLSVGADDYVTKPFSVRELVARVQVMLRRPRTSNPPQNLGQAKVFGPLSLDLQAREVSLDGQEVALTRTEFDLLAALACSPRTAFTRPQLVQAVWGAEWVGDDHIADVHVAHIRKKLGDDPTDPRFILTVRGVGYRMGPGQ